jgi:hypothetical protein
VKQRRKLVPALTVSALTTGLLTLQTTLPAAADPRSAGSTKPTRSAQPAAHAARSTPAWLAELQKRSVRYVDDRRTAAHIPSPALSLVPRPERHDWVAWHQATNPSGRAAAQRRAAHATARVKAAVNAPTPRLVREDEPSGALGSNDTFRSAQRLATLGTRPGANAAVTVLGRLSPAPRPRAQPQARSKEDDGSFTTARDSGVSKLRKGFSTTGTIGDAPPRGNDRDPRDFDFYKMTLRAGELVDATMRRTSGNLEPFMVLVDKDWRSVAYGEFNRTTARVSGTVRSAGTYYLMTGGITAIYVHTGKVVRTEGRYSLAFTARAGDRDLYAVNLRAGDVLGVSANDAAGYVSVFDSKGIEVHGSPRDASFLYPADTPLPGGGNAVTDHVVRSSGTHFVEVTVGDGSYTADFEVYRYGGAAKKRTQTIFLDTDGQRMNTNIFGGRGVTTLSPLRAFLGRWGLGRSAERALVARIKATVKENLKPTCARPASASGSTSRWCPASTGRTASARPASPASSSVAPSPSPASGPSASPSRSTRGTSTGRRARWSCSTPSAHRASDALSTPSTPT